MCNDRKAHSSVSTKAAVSCAVAFLLPDGRSAVLCDGIRQRWRLDVSGDYTVGMSKRLLFALAAYARVFLSFLCVCIAERSKRQTASLLSISVADALRSSIQFRQHIEYTTRNTLITHMHTIVYARVVDSDMYSRTHSFFFSLPSPGAPLFCVLS